MSEVQILELVNEVMSTSFQAFWYESPLLARCQRQSDPRIVEALAIRHHGLSNKDAGSCQVLRQTIKHIEGPKFPTLWKMSLRDDEDIQATVNYPGSIVWAAAFILGEIGGKRALLEACRLINVGQIDPYLGSRITCHLIIRYFAITDSGPPMAQVMDVHTGEMREVPLGDFDAQMNERQVRDRSEANEYFEVLSPSETSTVEKAVNSIPASILPMAKMQLLTMLTILGKPNFWQAFEEARLR